MSPEHGSSNQTEAGRIVQRAIEVYFNPENRGWENNPVAQSLCRRLYKDYEICQQGTPCFELVVEAAKTGFARVIGMSSNEEGTFSDVMQAAASNALEGNIQTTEAWLRHINEESPECLLVRGTASLVRGLLTRRKTTFGGDAALNDTCSSGLVYLAGAIAANVARPKQK